MAIHPRSRFIETENLEDLDYEALQKLVQKCPRHPHPRETRTERDYYAKLNLFELIVTTEYMRHNMLAPASRDTIVYEGAVREYVIPALIKRLIGIYNDSKFPRNFVDEVIHQLKDE